MQPLYWVGISKSPQSMVLLRYYPEQQVRRVWDILSPAYNARQREGRTLEEHEHSVAECGDKPGSLEQNMLWLREADFSELAALLVVDGRTLITAVTR